MGTLRVHIFSGGIIDNVRPLTSVGCVAYGGTGRALHRLLGSDPDVKTVNFHRTRMAGGKNMETSSDIENRFAELKSDRYAKTIFVTCAFPRYRVKPCEWKAFETEPDIPLQRVTESGKDLPMLRHMWPIVNDLKLFPMKDEEHVFNNIRAGDSPREDFFLVLFQATTGATIEGMEKAGKQLLTQSKANIVFVNDLHTKSNLIVTNGDSFEASDRRSALVALIRSVKTMNDIEERKQEVA